MGEFATAVQSYIQQKLSSKCPALDWQTEYHIDGTPVDVAGMGENALYLVELEWRRADPADNTAKLFRHLDSGSISHRNVHVFQVFTRYYDLASGDYSSKRKNAEFVGQVASRASPQLRYNSLDLDIDPPKRGGQWPTEWHSTVDSTLGCITDRID